LGDSDPRKSACKAKLRPQPNQLTEKFMSKTSRTALIATLVAAAVAAPTLSQTAAARRAVRHHGAAAYGRLYNGAPGGLYDYAPGGLYDYAPGPYSPLSNHPAATGGGSLGYNVDTLRNN